MPESTTTGTSDIASRLARWRLTGDPKDLWPDVEPEEHAAAHRHIADVTRAALAGTEAPPRIGGGIPREGEALEIAAFVSGMGPLLGYWIEKGFVHADRDRAAVFSRHLKHGRARATRIHAEFCRILRALNDRGITPVVFKGAHTSQSYFPEHGVRPLSDIDLLVRPARRMEAADALRTAGLVKQQQLYARQSEWGRADASGKVHSLRMDHELNPWAVDLHWSVNKRYFRGVWSSFGSLPFTSVKEWAVNGLSAHVFAQPLLTAYLAQHGAAEIHQIRLVRLVELVLVIRRDTTAGVLRWDALAALLADTQTVRFVYPALRLAEWLAPGLVDPDFLRETERATNPRMRRVLERLESSGMHLSDSGSLDERLLWANGAAQIVQNLSDYAWPPAVSHRDRARKYAKLIRMILARRIAIRS